MAVVGVVVVVVVCEEACSTPMQKSSDRIKFIKPMNAINAGFCWPRGRRGEGHSTDLAPKPAQNRRPFSCTLQERALPRPPATMSISAEDQHPARAGAQHRGVPKAGAGRRAAGAQLTPAVGLSARSALFAASIGAWNICMPRLAGLKSFQSRFAARSLTAHRPVPKKTGSDTWFRGISW